MKRIKIIDIAGVVLGSMALGVSNAYAFSKLKNGFETITNTYLIPLSGAVAGASFLLFIILGYFKQEEYQKKIANVLMLAVLSAVGLDLITTLTQSFS